MALIHLLTRPAAAAAGNGGAKQPRRAGAGAEGPAAAGARGKAPAGSGVRVLVAAHTNVAVDRVLMGLAGGRGGVWLPCTPVSSSQQTWAE